MKRRFKSRPAPTASVVAAVGLVFMLIFGISFFSQAKAAPGPVIAFMVVWVALLVAGIIYHIANATSPGGVPTQIIESEDDVPQSKSTAERLQDLEDLRNRKLVTDAEYAAKRQDILREV
jgi:ABC-type multidrug transport system fused ATPase/permease subunit